ncbi:serine hydrolase [Chryseobacterium sp. JK1]|uniref:serine hydrolase n=1 Tax=Chryseobacterium sp. JK1 TaxID=874294 RepID=UPI003D685908
MKPSNSGAVWSIFEPGLKYEYSGGGTTISQLILENTTSEKYEDYILKNILTPLEMNNSSFSQPPAKDKESFLATGYNYDKEVKGK